LSFCKQKSRRKFLADSGTRRSEGESGMRIHYIHTSLSLRRGPTEGLDLD